MRRTGGGLVVLLFASLTILSISVSGETSISHPAHLTVAFCLLRTSPCYACHDLDNFPFLKIGTNTPPHNLSNIDISDGCHSPGGIYTIVEDPTVNIVDIKDNRRTGVYELVYDPCAGNITVLQAGKERWWVGCHDYV